jgi:flagellar hook assembly protein FlgD
MFANGTDDEKKSSATVSGAAVIKNGESTFRVIYKSEKEANVRVAIYNAKNELVYSERVSNTDGFTRPYNLESQGEGDYTISIEDGSRKQVEKVSYRTPRVTKSLNVLRAEEGKYVVMAAGQGDEVITVSIYDGQSNLVHRSFESTKGNFSKLYNLKQIKGHLTFEIANENGEVKSVAY